ncbi:hypothetical protein V2J09_009378 [Rumex salicifolius]
MDEPFIIIEESSRSAATPRRGYSPGFLDLNNDSVLPTIISTPRNSLKNLLANLTEKRRLTKRSHSAPSLFTDERELARAASSMGKLKPKTSIQIVRLASIGLLIYLAIGLAVFMFTHDMFSGDKTLVPVDALYFTVVTLCTIGYGDIVPDTTFTKLFTCVFILVGFGFIDILLNGLVTHVLDRQEAVLLGAMDENRFNFMVNTYLVDKEKGRMRIRTKVGLALGVVVFCLALGTIIVHYIETLSWVDSFYLSVTSVTTVGYGDYNFKTVTGRSFAVVWLLVSTLAVARAFLYLTEFRIDKRNRRVAKWVLHKKMSLGDLVAADWDNDGSISKSEYVIYKLKEMGKITDKDIMPICRQFESLENSHSGKLTFASLQEEEIRAKHKPSQHSQLQEC